MSTDQDILDLLKQPESKERCFNMLMLRYKERVYWHARKMVVSHEDADDVAQNTFVKVWRYLDDFRGDSSLFTWIYRIASNETLTFIASRQRKYAFALNDLSYPFEDVLKADPYFEGSDLEIKLHKSIMKLPEKQRLVFNMRYFEEMKFKQMSEILDTSVGALKASYHLASKKIKDEMKASD